MADKVINKEALINMVGDFTYMFGMHFFIETEVGNFVWSDPDYQGDNTMTLFKGTYKDYCKQDSMGGFGRCKGKHLIGRYCGEDFTVVIPK
jgi:hypothetical protein